MSYRTDTIGIQEAILVATQSFLQSKLSDLNLVLQLAPLNYAANYATNQNIIIGDPARADFSTDFQICVLGAGRVDGRQMASEFKEVGVPFSVSSIKYKWNTKIRVYLNPDTFPVAASNTISVIETQAAKREYLISRLCDWIRGEYGTVAGVDMTLASKEYQNTGDNLTMQKIDSVIMGVLSKGFADNLQCYGAQFDISAITQ